MTVYFTRLLTTAEPAGTPAARQEETAELQATLNSDMQRKRDFVKRWSTGTLAEVGLTEDDFFQLVGTLNRKISSLQATLAARDPANAAADRVTDATGWSQGTVSQRRVLMRRYLDGVQVLPPVTGTGGSPTQRIRQRLHPAWRTAEELAA